MAFDKKLLKSEFVLHGMSLGDLATLLHLTKPTISKKMNGISEWTLSEIQTIGKMIGNEKVMKIFFAEKVS